MLNLPESNYVYYIWRASLKTTKKSIGNCMKITIKLFATLRDFGPGIKEVSVSENSTIEKIVKSFNLPEETPLLTIVNGVHTDPKEMLKERDVLALFPPVGGG